MLVARAGTSVTVSQQTDGQNLLDDSDVELVANMTFMRGGGNTTDKSSEKENKNVSATASPVATQPGAAAAAKNNKPARKGLPQATKDTVQAQGSGRGKSINRDRKTSNKSSGISAKGTWHAASAGVSNSSSGSTNSNSSKMANRLQDWDADTKAQVAQQQEEVWLQAEAWIEAEAEAEEEEWKKLDKAVGTVTPRGSTSTPTSLTLQMDLIDEDDSNLIKALRSPPHSQGRTAMYTPLGLGGHRRSMSRPTSATREGGGTGSSAGTPLSAGRSLHDKLSSPDRRRALSPSEAKRRHEARQSAAEILRESELALRIEKASIASARVKMVGEMKAAQRAEQEQALEDRMMNAEKRHGEHIRSIKGKAGNENNKVNEVKFLNTMNDAMVAEELQRRLSEVEARTLAAWQRKQDMLGEIAAKNQKRQAKKTQQMSALRLQLEEQKMERWGRLQNRLSSVQARRDARLAELQRRKDEDRDRATSSGSDSSVPSSAITTPAKTGVPDADSNASSENASPAQESETVILNNAINENKREIQIRRAQAAHVSASAESFSTASFIMSPGTTFTDGKGSSSSSTTQVYASASKTTTGAGSGSATVSPVPSHMTLSEGAVNPPAPPSSGSALFKEPSAPGAIQDPQRPSSLSDAYGQVMSAQKKGACAKGRKAVLGAPAKVKGDSQSICTLLRDAVGDSEDESSREEPFKLQGRCGALVLHLLYHAGLVTAKQLEVTSGSGDRSDDEDTMPKGITSTTACKKLRRAFDEHAPMLSPDDRLSEVGLLMVLDSLQQVHVTDKHAAKTFKEGGGILLLRTLLDAEIGIMSHEPLLYIALRAPGMGKAMSLAVHCCESASEPTASPRFVTQCFRLGVSLGDLSALLLHHTGAFLKRISEARTDGTAGLPADDKSAAMVGVAAEHKPASAMSDSPGDGDKENQASPQCGLGVGNEDVSPLSLSGSPAKGALKAAALTSVNISLKHASAFSSHPVGSGQSESPTTWVADDAAVLPTALQALCGLIAVPNPQQMSDWEATGGKGGGSLMNPTSVKLRADLLWYLFASQHIPLLSHTIRSLQTLGQDVSADPFFVVLITTINRVLVRIGWYLRADSGLGRCSGEDPIEKVAQLSSAARCKHPQARSILSMLRTNDMPVSLLALLDAVLSAAVSRSDASATGAGTTATAEDSAVLTEEEKTVCASLVRALLALGGADLNLVQRFSSDQRNSIILSLGVLLRDWCVGAAEEEPRGSPWLPYSLAEDRGYVMAQILALLGLLCLRDPDMQSRVSKPMQGGLGAGSNGEGAGVSTAGMSSLGARSEPLIVELCRSMPVRYFADERYKIQLLPTLAAMCLDCPESLAVLRNTLSLEILGTHMSRLGRDLHEMKSGTLLDVNSPALLLQLSARFPTELWPAALSLTDSI